MTSFLKNINPSKIVKNKQYNFIFLATKARCFWRQRWTQGRLRLILPNSIHLLNRQHPHHHPHNSKYNQDSFFIMELTHQMNNTYQGLLIILSILSSFYWLLPCTSDKATLLLNLRKPDMTVVYKVCRKIVKKFLVGY